jgi:hypothetical protein
MSELTPKPDSTDRKNKKKCKKATVCIQIQIQVYVISKHKIEILHPHALAHEMVNQ